MKELRTGDISAIDGCFSMHDIQVLSPELYSGNVLASVATGLSVYQAQVVVVVIFFPFQMLFMFILCVCLTCMHGMQYPQRPEEGVRYRGTGVTLSR